AGRVLSSELMQRLRKQHYEERVTPMLEQVQELLHKAGKAIQADVRVENGDPIKKIAAMSEQERFSTLLMCRHKRVDDGMFSGNVLSGVLNRTFTATAYVIGENGFAPGVSPAARIV